MELGLRERKKRETFARIVAATRSLVAENGLGGTTVEQIAAAADISLRTFFNYFASKEDAVIGSDPQLTAQSADALRQRPAGEGPIEALRATIMGDGDDAMLQRWVLRNELVRRHPELLARHLTAFERVNAEFTRAIADRMGVDLRVDPRPAVIVTTVLAGMRSTITWWQHSDRSADLIGLLNTTFGVLGAIDPEVPYV